MQLIAVSLIGIPASAKTSLAHRIIDLSKHGVLSSSVIVISFDEYLNMDYDRLHDGDYKRLREELIIKIEDLLGQLLKNEIQNWEQILISNDLKIQKNHYNIRTNDPTLPILIILDDNNYFRSMRQRNRALCKNLMCRHFQIFMKSSMDEARRETRIDFPRFQHQ